MFVLSGNWPKEWFALVLLALLSGCDNSDHERANPAPVPKSRRPAVTAQAVEGDEVAKLKPLSAEGGLIELPVEGFGMATVSVPLGATAPRPIIAVLHGSRDRPEWQCGTWRGLVLGKAFVLCPRGQPLPGDETPARFTFTSIQRTRQELRAALKALKQRFGRHVAPNAIVLAGYSLGANHAAFIVKEDPAFFSRVVFIEGALDAWTSTSVKTFAERGGERLLFVCAQPVCVEKARARVALTERAGIGARLVDAGDLGHLFDGRVTRAMSDDFDWLVAGQPWFDMKSEE